MGQIRQVELNIPYGHLFSAPIPATPYSQTLAVIVPSMKKRQLTGLLIALLPLLAFQCHKYTKYVKQIQAKVTPEIIKLTSDTISFQLQLGLVNYKPKKRETFAFQLWALADGNTELISTIKSNLEEPVDTSIKELLKINERVESLGLRFQKYHGHNLELESPIMEIAVVKDIR